jgi:hypothetical protein
MRRANMPSNMALRNDLLKRARAMSSPASRPVAVAAGAAARPALSPAAAVAARSPVPTPAAAAAAAAAAPATTRGRAPVADRAQLQRPTGVHLPRIARSCSGVRGAVQRPRCAHAAVWDRRQGTTTSEGHGQRPWQAHAARHPRICARDRCACGGTQVLCVCVCGGGGVMACVLCLSTLWVLPW